MLIKQHESFFIGEKCCHQPICLRMIAMVIIQLQRMTTKDKSKTGAIGVSFKDPGPAWERCRPRPGHRECWQSDESTWPTSALSPSSSWWLAGTASRRDPRHWSRPSEKIILDERSSFQDNQLRSVSLNFPKTGGNWFGHLDNPKNIRWVQYFKSLI